LELHAVKRLHIRIGDTINPVAVLFGIGREFPRCKREPDVPRSPSSSRRLERTS
jgi:hypothetical protein